LIDSPTLNKSGKNNEIRGVFSKKMSILLPVKYQPTSLKSIKDSCADVMELGRHYNELVPRKILWRQFGICTQENYSRLD
jgi:hypothetical protein